MWLALETSSDRASVAVGRPGEVLAEVSLEGARQHAGALPRLIEEALSLAGVDLGALTDVVLGDGPGSFTGLRVGASVAKALVRSRGVAFHTAPALAAVAWSAAPSPEERVLAVANALRGEVYAAEYRFPEGRLEVLQEPMVWLPERLLADCPVPDVVCGIVPEGLAERLVEWSAGHHPRTVRGMATAGHAGLGSGRLGTPIRSSSRGAGQVGTGSWAEASRYARPPSLTRRLWPPSSVAAFRIPGRWRGSARCSGFRGRSPWS
jgi:tRNA threonylcarbamoyl adenosine modification protein YeaZ